MEKQKNFIKTYILDKFEYFRSENIETGKTPHFIIYCSKGNDRETLNLYFDYKTSKQYINRCILALGPWLDFNSDQIKELETIAVESLNLIGIEAESRHSTYQNEITK